MKYDIGFIERGYTANLYRIRASRQRQLAADRSMSATRQELESEAAWCEAQAQKLDDAEEPTTVSDKEPIKAGGRKDIDQADPPKTTATILEG